MPGWYAHGLEVHPIFEENYCLSGDVNIGEVDGGDGYTMTEGCYLCRPPGIPHGPISSKNGNVNFCYHPAFWVLITNLLKMMRPIFFLT